MFLVVSRQYHQCMYVYISWYRYVRHVRVEVGVVLAKSLFVWQQLDYHTISYTIMHISPNSLMQ